MKDTYKVILVFEIIIAIFGIVFLAINNQAGMFICALLIFTLSVFYGILKFVDWLHDTFQLKEK